MTKHDSDPNRRLKDALHRERRARTAAELRAGDEEALRRAAEMVNESDRLPEVLENIGRCALEACGADGSVVTRVRSRPAEVEVVAAAGEHIVPTEYRLPYAGSLTRAAIVAGQPITVPHIASSGNAGITLPPMILERCGDWSAIVVPLSGGPAARGALLLLRRPIRPLAGPREVNRARTFGTLASIALRKAHLLSESNRRRKELEEVMQSRDRLIRGFSHDLKNPMGAADAYLELMELEVVGPFPEYLRHSLARARRAIATALSLVDALVDLARADAGRMDVESVPVDVRELIDDVVDEYRAVALTRKLSVRTELPADLPVIQSDAARIHQVLGNLLSNAVKYNAPAGRVTIRAELVMRPHGDGQSEEHRGPPSGSWLCIGVVDTGAGIPPEKQGLLFREFVRLQADDTPGAGLGLAISSRIARALGGRITVESEPGRGSTFCLWLPLPRQ
jgi:signal transduction histidine kinase